MDIKAIQKCLDENDGVTAAYLFGSVARKDSVTNDVDILVLMREDADRIENHARLTECLSDALKIPAKRIDILFMDLNEVAPRILYEAINQGILLKNEDKGLLSDRIELISMYLLINEPMIRRAGQLRKERVEAFCES